MMQSILYDLKIITIDKMFRKYNKNPVELSCINKEKTVTACSCCKKENKVYKKGKKFKLKEEHY